MQRRKRTALRRWLPFLLAAVLPALWGVSGSLQMWKTLLSEIETTDTGD